MEYKIEVENIRCGGCASTISKKLLENDDIKSVDIQIDDQIVVIDVDNESVKEVAIDVLAGLGYPLKGSVEGVAALKGKAKSVVSCAIGKMG